MGALAADYAWTSEDDFKLKTAAQSGVPLESIATGAVQFSKQFTVEELHDRWHALLYDPVIAAEASARMLEFEFFALTSQILNVNNDQDNIEDSISVSKKRKPEGVRRRYYAMRKRMRIHPLNPLDFSFPHNATTFNSICIENEEQEPPSAPATDFVVNGVVKNNEGDADMDLDANQQILFHENQNRIGEDGLIEDADEFKEILDMLEDEGPESPAINAQTLHSPHPPDSSAYNFFREEERQSMATTSNFHVKLENEMCGGNTTTTNTNGSNNYLMEISNTLFDLDMEDDGNVIDKSYIDGLSSLLLDSPKKEEDANCDSTFPLADECLMSQSNYYCGREETKSLEGIMGNIPVVPSTSGMSSKSHTCSVIICTLNTEDPDIPSNDDVFLLPFTSASASSLHQSSSKSFRDTEPPGWKKDFRAPNNRYQKSQYDTPPIIIGSQQRTEMLGDHRIEEDLANNGGHHEDQTQVHPVDMKSENGLHCGSDLFTNFCAAKLNYVVGNNNEEENTLATIQEEGTLHDIVSKEVVNPILAVLQLPVDDDMSSLSDDDDDDMPSFSDVEAMILDEKLSEDEKNIYLNGNWSYRNLQTLKYKNQNFQRRFIRLEQAANGYMKRDLTSWGAFAVLQGWEFIYYVKKPEILMGRATEDVIVDVDLGREGCDCRISRRQAIIQLDREGLFRIKNLGKYSIFVNSDELSRNQSTTLTSSCLIEIRGMSFLFETNEESIKRYADSMNNKSDVED